MREFPIHLLQGAALALATLGAVSALAQRYEPRPAAGSRGEAELPSEFQTELETLRQQNLINEQLLHHQRLHNMTNESMWQNFYRQQEMIRSTRY